MCVAIGKADIVEKAWWKSANSTLGDKSRDQSSRKIARQQQHKKGIHQQALKTPKKKNERQRLSNVCPQKPAGRVVARRSDRRRHSHRSRGRVDRACGQKLD